MTFWHFVFIMFLLWNLEPKFGSMICDPCWHCTLSCILSVNLLSYLCVLPYMRGPAYIVSCCHHIVGVCCLPQFLQKLYSVPNMTTCPTQVCDANYIRETARLTRLARLSVRTEEHSGKDQKLLLAQHLAICEHQPVCMSNLRVIAQDAYGGTFSCKILESQQIGDKKPSLNSKHPFHWSSQQTSIPLKLFSCLT